MVCVVIVIILMYDEVFFYLYLHLRLVQDHNILAFSIVLIFSEERVN